MKKFFLISLILFFAFFNHAFCEDVSKVRVGSLQYGSVNWELKLIKELELDKKYGF